MKKKAERNKENLKKMSANAVKASLSAIFNVAPRVRTYTGNQLNSTSMEFNYTETDRADKVIKVISFASILYKYMNIFFFLRSFYSVVVSAHSAHAATLSS